MSLRARWRTMFGLPRTDPRYLAATDEDIADDLLDALYMEGERRRNDPELAQLERVLRDPQRAREEDDDLAAQLAGDGTLAKRIRQFEAARKAHDQGRKVTSVKPPPNRRKKKGPK